jgi:hypothetical protein
MTTVSVDCPAYEGIIKPALLGSKPIQLGGDCCNSIDIVCIGGKITEM